MPQFFGYHLMLDCADCHQIDNRDTIYRFIKTLVERIDMTAHGEPIIEYLLEGDPKQGYSLMQLITTSNICAHFMELSNTAFFDVFSCKTYDQQIVLDTVNEFFHPGKVRVNFITRDAG